LFRLVPAEIDSNIFVSCTRGIVVDSNVVTGAVIDIPIDQDVTKIRSTFPYCINLALNTIFDFREHLDSSLSPDMEATKWTRAYWRAMLLLRSQDVPDLSKLQAYLYDNL